MSPVRILVVFLFIFSLLKIILFYGYFKNFKPRKLTDDEIKAFDEEDDKAFFEEDEFD